MGGWKGVDKIIKLNTMIFLQIIVAMMMIMMIILVTMIVIILVYNDDDDDDDDDDDSGMMILIMIMRCHELYQQTLSLTHTHLFNHVSEHLLVKIDPYLGG